MEETFRNAGFTVVHPQELALAEQLAIYRRADCLAGQYSSALHNSLFARRGINLLTDVDPASGALANDEPLPA